MKKGNIFTLIKRLVKFITSKVAGKPDSRSIAIKKADELSSFDFSRKDIAGTLLYFYFSSVYILLK